MTSSDLYTLFRGDVADTEQPYLWSDTEVFLYMNDAYRMFVRKIGGIADFTSAATQIPVVAGVTSAALDPSVLRVMSAYRVSDGAKIDVLNSPDFPRPATATRPVCGMVIGEQDGAVRWTSIPPANDTAQLTVYRMPAGFITDAGQPFTGVAEDHHSHLLEWMLHLAYKKQDADTFDKNKSETAKQTFLDYCAEVTAEKERLKHKTRTVAYGGL